MPSTARSPRKARKPRTPAWCRPGAPVIVCFTLGSDEPDVSTTVYTSTAECIVVRDRPFGEREFRLVNGIWGNENSATYLCAAPPAGATKTIAAHLLNTLPTPELIAQYDWALRDFKGRQTNTSPRQKRINLIVDLLSARAEAGDAEANTWFEADLTSAGAKP